MRGIELIRCHLTEFDLSKPFKSQHRHPRPSHKKDYKQPPNQPPAFLLCQLIWNRTPLCYFKHIITLLLNQKILSDLKKNNRVLKYDVLQVGAEVAKGMVLLHRPELWGKLGMHLSVALSGSDLLTFTGKKPLGASQRAAGCGNTQLRLQIFTELLQHWCGQGVS